MSNGIRLLIIPRGWVPFLIHLCERLNYDLDAHQMDLRICSSIITRLFTTLSTAVALASSPAVAFDWRSGDFICVPPMIWHRHYNSSKTTAVRMLLIENTTITEKLTAQNYRASRGAASTHRIGQRLGDTRRSEASPMKTQPPNFRARLGWHIGDYAYSGH